MKYFLRGILLGLLLLPAGAQAGYDYINISNPFLHKISIAVPVFQTAADTEKEPALARKAADLLAETLTFTCYFKTVNRRAFLEKPKETGVTKEDITYKNWRDIGAEFLVTGKVFVKEEIATFELRLFDLFKQKMLIGKRYKGPPEDFRTIVRRFCGEIMQHFTGHRGIFESKIAFISTGPGNKEVYVCDFDGHDPRRKTRNNSLELSPAWSWDGEWLAYTSYKGNNPDLYIRHLRDNRGVIFSRKGVNISPAWIPGRFALAATLSFSGDQEIYMLTGSGKIIKRLTNSWNIDVSPTFAPDGKKMAFVSKRCGSPQIYMKDIESGAIQRLTFEGEYNTTPAWSPTGDKIAYSTLENGEFNIKVIDVKTRETVRLTENQGDNECPAWSPDGSLIAFSSTRKHGKSKIFVMTALGTDQRQLLSLPGQQTSPDWSRGATAEE